MFQANYPVLGRQECYPFYLAGIGISAPEFHTVREKGLISHQILFTLEGTGKIIIDGKEYISKPGGIFYVASGVSHEYYPIGDKWTTCWMVFRGDSLSVLMERLGFSTHVYGMTKELEKVKNLFDRIYAATKRSNDGEELCSILVYQYIMLIHRLLITQQEGHTGTVIDNAVAYMDRHYSEDISLQTLAQVCDISTQHFCRVFHEKMRMRPMEYLARKRIGEAKVALYNTQDSIAQIGQKVGYADPNYFGIVFKKYEGISPRQFRQERKNISL